MALTAQKPQTGPAPAPVGPQARRLKKGEMLFDEGDTSRAMYYVKSGMIRIFKKKGESSIEIDTVRSGQIVGELAFLDGNPRSASGEALTDCDLMEISGPTFQSVLTNMPEWLKILLKTVVGRLRTASTRIRQLESASTAMDYTDKGSKAHYVFISLTDAMKMGTAVLLVASRNGEKTSYGIDIRLGLVQRYAYQIMGVPAAKITAFIDILSQAGVAKTADVDGADSATITITDVDFIEQLIFYMNEENLLQANKRHDLSVKAFLLMSFIHKHLAKYKPNEEGIATVNVAEIQKAETKPNGKEPFRMDELPELVTLGFASNVAVKSADEVNVDVKPDAFRKAYRIQRIIKTLDAINDQKRKNG